MSFIDDVRADRKPLADTIVKHPGIRKVVEKAYPDTAHFIYELLQNAEDTGATEVSFKLQNDLLSFEHNGSPFNEDDVWGITDYGDGTKDQQEDKIGQFGIGFKSVFAYSETPRIFSPTYSFEISQLVLPKEIKGRANLGSKTRFEFPLNNSNKTPKKAFDEIEVGLGELGDETLLYIHCIETVSWHVTGKKERRIQRINHSEEHIEISRMKEDEVRSRSHFLRYDDEVNELPGQHVALAFELSLLPKSTSTKFNPLEPLHDQFEVVPAKQGRVAIFFPAKKETSGLRFHLHAPFVSDISRASVKKSKENDPLFDQLAASSATCLYKIRDLGLLNSKFLSVLPNSQDQLQDEYVGIREAIVDEMKNEPLVPTHAKGHEAGRNLRQAKASLKNLLSAEDLKSLIGDKDCESPQWAAGAPQKNSNADRFLEDLEIYEWGIDEFAKEICVGVSINYRFYGRSYNYGPNKELMQWLADKPTDWIQQMYSLLNEETSWYYPKYSKVKIVRLSGGGFAVPTECYFSGPETNANEDLSCVDPEVLTSGKSKKRQEGARKFLEGIGVKDYGELEQIKMILEERYSEKAEKPNQKTHLKDLRRFMKFARKNPSGLSEVFGAYYIFMRADDTWGTPEATYLDDPYEETGLKDYYQLLNDPRFKDKVLDEYERDIELSQISGLSHDYIDWGLKPDRMSKFAKAVGVRLLPIIQKITIKRNRARAKLKNVWGQRWTYTGINRDYIIDGLQIITEEPSIKMSRLIWKTMHDSGDKNYFRATYQLNQSGGSSDEDSMLLYLLRDEAWVPQGGGNFVKPSEADPGKLPEGFAYEKGKRWLTQIEFGKAETEAKVKSEQEEEEAKKSGFKDVAEKKRAQEFAQLPESKQKQILTANKKTKVELPDREPANPDRRKEKVKKRAKRAPSKDTEKRGRSVSVGIDEIKKEADSYLRYEYTRDDHKMFCQICKDELPFRGLDGEYYFETTELFGDIKKLHRENYLALCPNHGAMFKYVNESKDELRKLFEDMTDQYMEVQLAGETCLVYFTKTHMLDLQWVLEAVNDEA